MTADLGRPVTDPGYSIRRFGDVPEEPQIDEL